jgi:hypothetical protein
VRYCGIDVSGTHVNQQLHERRGTDGVELLSQAPAVPGSRGLAGWERWDRAALRALRRAGLARRLRPETGGAVECRVGTGGLRQPRYDPLPPRLA